MRAESGGWLSPDPLPIWDKESGEIDSAVATYWRENYDLSYILRRDWDTLWPKVRPAGSQLPRGERAYPLCTPVTIVPLGALLATSRHGRERCLSVTAADRKVLAAVRCGESCTCSLATWTRTVSTQD